MFLKFKPKSAVLDELFLSQANILRESADLLVYIASQQAVSEKMLDEMAQKEHKADTVAREIYERLENTYSIPYEPADGYRLGRAMEDVIDAIHVSAKKMHVYELSPARHACGEFASVVHAAAAEIGAGVASIGNKKEKLEKTKKHCAELHHLESVGDEIYTRNIKKLMRTTNVLDVVKLKDVYDELERTVDLANDVGYALECVALKKKV